ncbi:hypothetical protein AU511_00620 [Lonsdalea iberica]|uniref:Uncharacterized protein n=1 Tax=Lonsdalea iberica TaxID=1082703 RepID=A0A1X3S2K5_9GAMM|nr:hypothetical protein AU511_00620 [Lonsdalea iberica]
MFVSQLLLYYWYFNTVVMSTFDFHGKARAFAQIIGNQFRLDCAKNSPIAQWINGVFMLTYRDPYCAFQAEKRVGADNIFC